MTFLNRTRITCWIKSLKFDRDGFGLITKGMLSGIDWLFIGTSLDGKRWYYSFTLNRSLNRKLKGSMFTIHLERNSPDNVKELLERNWQQVMISMVLAIDDGKSYGNLNEYYRD